MYNYLFEVISKVALTPAVFGPGNPAPYSIDQSLPTQRMMAPQLT